MNKQKNAESKKNPLKLILNVIFYILVAILLFFAAISITTRITNGKIGSSQYLVIISSSMEGEEKEEYDIKTIKVKSLIKVDLVENDSFYSTLKKGDIITFNYLSLGNETITHRIVEDPILTDGVYKYKVQGDAVTDDYQTLYSDGRTGEIIGKVTFVSYPIGVFYFFINSKLGTVILVILPSSAICIYEIAKVIFIVSERKRLKKEVEVNKTVDEKDAEIERLKKLLEEKKEKEE